MRVCDVLVIGGGLSGLSAAYHLSRLGVKDVLIIERMSDKSYGHYHRTCGEAISDRLLTLSGVPRGCIVRDVRGIRITCGGIDMDVPVKGHIIDREALLRDLRDGSGAELINDSIITVRKDGDGFIASSENEEYRCRYLIGADGVFSKVRKDIFDYEPEVRFPAVNNIVEGDSETDVLGFEVSSQYPGAYRWDFPSKDGRRSIGYVKDTDDLDQYIERGVRFIAVGRRGPVVEGQCCLVGDAAVLTNPMCYGGIGAALLSGRKAAECIAKGDLRPYQRWVERDRMFDQHFMEALRTFRTWDPEDYEDSVVPFRKGYSLFRGFFAILRRPRWANVYMSIWVAFRRGW